MGSQECKLTENVENKNLNLELKNQRPKAEAKFNSLQKIQVKDPGEPEHSIEIDDYDCLDRSPCESINTSNY